MCSPSPLGGSRRQRPNAAVAEAGGHSKQTGRPCSSSTVGAPAKHSLGSASRARTYATRSAATSRQLGRLSAAACVCVHRSLSGLGGQRRREFVTPALLRSELKSTATVPTTSVAESSATSSAA
jgi:hypothetical protein